MHNFISFTSLLFLLATLSPILPGVDGQKVVIPKTSFDSQADFDKVWGYNYPWGTDHNGAARMDKAQVSIGEGQLTLTARKVSGQPSASHGGKRIAINYLAGAVYAKQAFNVTRNGGYDFTGEFKATVARGTWPAFWLTGTQGWPPEIDMAEWKGSGKISFNSYNGSWQSRDVTYQNSEDWHKIKCEVRDTNGRDITTKFYMDDKLVTTQGGGGYFGKPMWLIINLQMEGSAGSPGPSSNTEYSVRNLEVLTYNQ